MQISLFVKRLLLEHLMVVLRGRGGLFGVTLKREICFYLFSPPQLAGIQARLQALYENGQLDTTACSQCAA